MVVVYFGFVKILLCYWFSWVVGWVGDCVVCCGVSC